jgi:hypothetical protein
MPTNSGLAASMVLGQRQSLVPSDLRDQALALTCIRACDHPDDREAIQRQVIELRNEYRKWLTLTQRKWQVKGKYTHHDTERIRERYVRCQ